MMNDSQINQAMRPRVAPSREANVSLGSQPASGSAFLKNTLVPLLLGVLALGLVHSAQAQSFTQSITYTPPAGKGFYDTVEIFMVGDPTDAFAAPGLTGFNDATPTSWTSRLRDRRSIVAAGIAPGTTSPSPLTFNVNVLGTANPFTVDLVVWDGGTAGSIIDTVRILADGAGAYETARITEAQVNWGGVPGVFVKRTAILIPASGVPPVQYPSQKLVKNVSANISKVTVEIKSLTHARPSDLQFLLVGPGGQKAMLMADAGGASAITGVNLVFDDAATAAVPATGTLVSGTYKPTIVGTRAKFPAPAPAGPYTSSLAVFNGTQANGTWSLYIFDDLAGAGGNLKVGWALTIQ